MKEFSDKMVGYQPNSIDTEERLIFSSNEAYEKVEDEEKLEISGWNDSHTVNQIHEYCYCRKDRSYLEPDLQCNRKSMHFVLQATDRRFRLPKLLSSTLSSITRYRHYFVYDRLSLYM